MEIENVARKDLDLETGQIFAVDRKQLWGRCCGGCLKIILGTLKGLVFDTDIMFCVWWFGDLAFSSAPHAALVFNNPGNSQTRILQQSSPLVHPKFSLGA